MLCQIAINALDALLWVSADVTLTSDPASHGAHDWASALPLYLEGSVCDSVSGFVKGC